MNNKQLITDLYSHYQKIVRSNRLSGVYQTRQEICLYLSTQPARRFYVTLSYAKRIIYSIRTHQPRAKQSRYRQHIEIYNRWQSLPQEERNDTSLQRIINSPAPSYYITPRRINELLYKATRI